MKIHLKSYLNLLKTKKITFLKIFENLAARGAPWKPTGPHGYPWVPMGPPGYPWVPMGTAPDPNKNLEHLHKTEVCYI